MYFSSIRIPLKKLESNPIYRDRSPTHSLKEPISMDDEDVSSSSDVIIFDSSSQQPESTLLAILSGVVPLSPLKVLPVTVLDEKERIQCLKELLNPNTFLSDITINAFSVSSTIARSSFPQIIQSHLCI